MSIKQFDRQKNIGLNRVIISFEVALVLADLSPILSEPVRFGVLFGAQAVFHNILVSAVSFGGITLLLDALGAIAVVELLDTKTTASMIKKANSLIKSAGLARLLNADTNMVSDLGITLLIGTPITLILKHRQNPQRSRRVNVRLGLFLSIVASLVSILQGAAIVAGLWQPNILTVLLAALAIVSIIALQKSLQKHYN